MRVIVSIGVIALTPSAPVPTWIAGAPVSVSSAVGTLRVPSLSLTRTWNAVSSVSGMRRALDLARDYAGRRRAFGALLRDKPLHADTLAGLEAEYAGAFLLAFRAAAVLGRCERGGDEHDQRLLRALTPIAKLTTAKQAVAIASEAIEACGRRRRSSPAGTSRRRATGR